MIRIQYKRGKYCPVFVCDQCGKPITDHASGIEVAPIQAAEGELLACYHVHQGTCDEAMERRLGAVCGWEDLGVHVARLLHNTKINGKVLRDSLHRAQLLDSITL